MCKIIRTKRLAGWLMFKGFNLIKMDKDKYKPKYDVYVFKNENGLDDEINNYIKDNKR